MKAIDLFAGIGGFHYAAKRNGVEVVFASEWDKYASEQYALNHGLVPQGDITKIDAKDIPDHDVLLGGFPCQAFSIAGNRKGFEDSRGTLFFEIARILAEKKPRAFLLENVPALLSHDKGNTFKVMERILQDLGYYLHAKCLNAKSFGLPQNRDRIFIVGFRDIAHFHSFKYPTGQPLTKVLRDVLETEVDKKYFVSSKMKSYIERKDGSYLKVDPEISPCLLATYGKMGSGSFISDKLQQVGHLDEKNSQSSRVYDTDGISVCLSSSGGGLGAKTGLIIHPTPDSSDIKTVGYVNGRNSQGYRVRSVDGVSATLSSSSGGLSSTGKLILVDGKNGEKASQRVYSSEGGYPCMTSILPLIESESLVRKLTPRECARLQGFPEDYKIACSDSQAYKQFGNSVAIPVVEAVLKNILMALNKKEV